MQTSTGRASLACWDFLSVNRPQLRRTARSSPPCGKGTDIFRRGGGERMSRELGVPFLGAIPLDAEIVESTDEGRPIVLEKPNSVAAMAYLAIATELAGHLQGLPTTWLKPFA